MVNGVPNTAPATTQRTARDTLPTSEGNRLTKERTDRTDQVELSETAREQIGRPESAPIRTKLVEQVRAQIAAGTYLTDDKLDAAVNRLRDEMVAVA